MHGVMSLCGLWVRTFIIIYTLFYLIIIKIIETSIVFRFISSVGAGFLYLAIYKKDWTLSPIFILVICLLRFLFYCLTDFGLFDCNYLTNGEGMSNIIFFRIMSLLTSLNNLRWSVEIISWNAVIPQYLIVSSILNEQKINLIF